MVICDGRALLVRPNYTHRLWTVPGGSVERNETYEQAACREIQEEVGIDIDNLTYIGEYTHVVDYRKDTVKAFIAPTQSLNFKVDGIEIKEAGWFVFDDLPQDRVPRIQQILDLHQAYLAGIHNSREEKS